MRAPICLYALICGLVACSSNSSGDDSPKTITPAPDGDASACPGTTASTGATATVQTVPTALHIEGGFTMQAIARVNGARQVAALPNGDLLVATGGTNVYLVPHADGDHGFYAPVKFATIDDAPVAGVAFDASSCRVYIGTNHGVYALTYTDGATSGTPSGPIALLRQQNDASHATTGLAVSGNKLYVSVGSSCNACVETDPTRATVQVMNLDGSNMTTYAKRFRNPIVLTTNPETGVVWGGGAGQDGIAAGHPFEIFDAVTAHAAGADYGWPDCEENHQDYGSGKDCANQVVPRVAMPAYTTVIGAAFYPTNQTGAHTFPTSKRGGAFVAMHGSWHEDGSGDLFAPSVAWVAMNGDTPAVAADWGDSHAQWSEFIGGFQSADGQSRVARPTGIAVGAQGSLFVADDQNGLIFRIRPQ